MQTQTLTAITEQSATKTWGTAADPWAANEHLQHLRVAVDCAKDMGLGAIPLLDKTLQPTGILVSMDNADCAFYHLQWKAEGVRSLLWAIAQVDKRERAALRPAMSVRHPAMAKAFRFFMERLNKGLPG